MSPENTSAQGFVVPRPGLARGLGIGNLVFASIVMVGLVLNACWLLVAFSLEPDPVAVQATPAPSPAGQVQVNVNLTTIGMHDDGFIRFVILDSITALILNGLLFASGIALVNLRAWGARWSTWIAWAKITRLVLIWGGFIVLVAPSFSENMARGIIEGSAFPPNRAPQLSVLTQAYGVLCLIGAVVFIVMGSVYPAASLWFLRRPGLRKALDGAGPGEVEAT